MCHRVPSRVGYSGMEIRAGRDWDRELESSVCREKLIFFGCEIVVVYTVSRHFVQIRESEAGAAAAAVALLRCRRRR